MGLPATAGAAVLYAGAAGYGLLLVVQLVRGGGGGGGGGRTRLDLGAQAAMALLLGALLQALGRGQAPLRQLDAHSALLALAGSLVLFGFGASVGRQWTLAAVAAAKDKRKGKGKGDHTNSTSTAAATASPAVTAATAPTSTAVELSLSPRHRSNSESGSPYAVRAEGASRARIWSDESVDHGGAGAGVARLSKDPFYARPTPASLLSPSHKGENIETYQGFNITRAFVDETVDALSTIVGVSTRAGQYVSKQWKLMPVSSNGTYLWTNTDKRDGLMLKGSTVTTTSAGAVVRWLLDRQMATGLEAIMYRSEVLVMSERENILIQRFVCKSERVLLSSRSFLVATAWRRLGEGSYAIVTRSLPEGVGKAGDKKSTVRGCIHACGYLVRSLADAAGAAHSTEVLYGTHLSFSRSGKTGRSDIDKAKLDEISKSVARALAQALAGAAEPYSAAKEPVSLLVGDSRDVLVLSSEQRGEALEVAARVLAKLEDTHRSALGHAPRGIFRFGSLPSIHEGVAVTSPHSSRGGGGGGDGSTGSPGGGENTWNDIYSQDGILVSERLDEHKTIGTLRATCSIDAPPSIIHNLLTKHPEVV
jgi:hypothetical protein